MNNVTFPKVEFVDFYRSEGHYLMNKSDKQAQYVFTFPHLNHEQIEEMGLQVSYLVSLDDDYNHNPKEMTALDLAIELKEYYSGFLLSGNAEPIKKLYAYLSEIEEDQEKIRNKFHYEYALSKVEYWKDKAKEKQQTTMTKKKELIAALVDEDEDLGKCITCGKPAVMRSYGGEHGDYCNSCGFAMLYRINGETERN